ncbi:MAG: hypothetical protein ACM3OB_04690, partial [Acidobacteriota bacterium]
MRRFDGSRQAPGAGSREKGELYHDRAVASTPPAISGVLWALPPGTNPSGVMGQAFGENADRSSAMCSAATG